MKERLVKLSGSADALLLAQAAAENMLPDVYGSLVLELAVRERSELQRRLAAAARKVDSER